MVKSRYADAEKNLKFRPSTYQQAIFNWVANGRGDAVVQAVAGSGKTTTLVEAANLLRTDKAVFLAFNKHVAEQLQKRLGDAITCKTIHSVGYGCLRAHIAKIRVKEGKYNDICKPYADQIANELQARYQRELRAWYKVKDPKKPKPVEPPNAGMVTVQLKKLAHFTRVTLTNPLDRAALESMVNHFDCLEDPLTLEMVQYALSSILKEGRSIAENRGYIDYDDMLWLPYVWGLEPRKCQWLFVDECQDLSPAQLDLVIKLRSPGGRMLFVGDRNQAIFGFAGASSDSVDRIIAATNAIVLPLSICYRCPTSHIELAQAIVPEIKPAEWATSGLVEHICKSELLTIIREGDLVISRCTAPLIKLCIELIAKRIPARVRGRDIGRALTNLVREIANHPDFEFKRFGWFLENYKEIKIEKLLQRRNSESQIESLRDRLDGIWACYEAFNCVDLNDFCQEIEDLFSDNRSSVVLSTIHRAKGLEEKRVFVLRPDQLPLRWANQQKWEEEQEQNLKYVALTRSKKSLYLVSKQPSETAEAKRAKDARNGELKLNGVSS